MQNFSRTIKFPVNGWNITQILPNEIITVKLTSISFPLSVQNAIYHHDIYRHYYDKM